jgi:rubrerythrin
MAAGHPPTRAVVARLYGGHDTLEVVGESFYQDALWRIVGGLRAETIRFDTQAVLVPEPDNPHDHNAIQVRISGALVGYLSRHDAATYLQGLLRLMEVDPSHLVALRGQIVGGGQRPDGLGFLGVFLDHDPADFGLARHHVSRGHLRTGLSDALDSDHADESYDLSWSQALSDDDPVAIRQLRTLLENEEAPIARHYMLCELEHRLYRCRNASPSALDEFDSTCIHHDREMEIIRPALVEKFDAVPVIEMYRQAAIRFQKAKLWEVARDWANRGIAMYGDDAARPEVVEDLRKRVEYATAKIDARGTDPRRSRVETVTFHVDGVVFETLICTECGSQFRRERTKGSKPRKCPSCRAL